MIKGNSKVLDGSGKSIFELHHTGLKAQGDTTEGVANTGVVTTKYSGSGLYIVSNDTEPDSAVIAVTVSSGTATAAKLSGSAAITITADTADSLNVYISGGVLVVQNLMGTTIDVTVKPYI